MAGAKETPRQKMIGMMYLVLTAMLALNVSKEILEAFVSVNENMVTTNKNFDEKLNDTYTQFSNMAATDQAAVEWYKRALDAKALSDSLVNYLIQTRSEVILKTEPRNEAYYNKETGKVNWDSLNNVSLNALNALDDYSTPSNYFLGEGDLLPGEAKTMKEKFAEYRDNILKTVKESDANKMKIGLKTDGKFENRITHEKMNWENYMFYHTILAADVVILNKYIAEVRNIEFDVLTKLMSYVGAEAFKFNKIEAKVIPEKNYVFKGDEYKAQILVAAYDTAESPDVRYRMGIDSLTAAMMDNAIEVPGENGIVNLTIPTSGMPLGEKNFAGVVLLRDPVNRNKFKQYHFQSTFNVGEPTAIISADKLNIFYKGINNPLSISIPGIPPSQVSYRKVSGSAQITQTAPGQYNVKPTGDIKSEIIIAAMANVDGAVKEMAKKAFTIEEVPNPTVEVAGRSGGSISKNGLLNAKPFVTAELKDFWFDSDELKYKVVRYQVNITVNGISTPYNYTGENLSDDLKQKIQSLRSGTNISFEKFMVTKPGGDEKALPGAIILNLM